MEARRLKKEARETKMESRIRTIIWIQMIVRICAPKLAMHDASEAQNGARGFKKEAWETNMERFLLASPGTLLAHWGLHEGSWEAQVAGRNAYRNHVRFCKRFCQRSVSVLSAFAPLRDAKEVPGRAPRSTGKPKLLAEMLTEIMCVSVSVSVSVLSAFCQLLHP